MCACACLCVCVCVRVCVCVCVCACVCVCVCSIGHLNLLVKGGACMCTCAYCFPVFQETVHVQVDKAGSLSVKTLLHKWVAVGVAVCMLDTNCVMPSVFFCVCVCPNQVHCVCFCVNVVFQWLSPFVHSHSLSLVVQNRRYSYFLLES